MLRRVKETQENIEKQKGKMITIVLALHLFLGLTSGKIYERCELARELRFVHKAPDHQLAVWVCIAEHESQYNTSVVGHLNGDGSGDHGIFQISDQYWCSPPGKGYACGITCAELEDDDITDDFLCAQKIYKEHQQLSGNGFNAWAVYQPLCSGSKAARYIKECFNDVEQPITHTTPATAFAHGFFDTAAGRANKGLLTSTEKLPLQPIFNFQTYATRNNLLETEKPKTNFITPKLSFFLNRYLTSTEKPNFNNFFTSTTSSTFRPTFSTTTAATSKLPTTNFIYQQSAINTFPSIASTVSTSSDNQLSKTSSLFLTPTISTAAFDSNTVTYNAPIFIVNGVKWY